MKNKYELIKGYQQDDKMRMSFNALALEMFKLNFEDWYQNGFWGDNYIPYSIVLDGQVIANVSVSQTNMVFNGEVRKYIQLGTVMTAKEYRNIGLIRQIMDEIEKDYNDKVEGTYLFANESVLEFYPKFGFKKSAEYQYEIDIENHTEFQFEKVVMDCPEAWKKLLNAMDRNIFCGKFDMAGNQELIMFYVTKFMQEDVWYHKESDTFVIAEIGEEVVVLHNVFSSTLDSMEKIVPLFGKEIKHLILGFTPENIKEYKVKEIQEEDTTFFIKGENLDVIEKEKLRVPTLAHA